MRRRRPPKRRCPRCGGDSYNWVEHALCRACVDDVLDDRVALTELTRGRRTPSEHFADSARSITGSHDGIPY